MSFRIIGRTGRVRPISYFIVTAIIGLDLSCGAPMATSAVSTTDPTARKSGLSKRDDCHAAVLHNEMEDIPKAEILQLFQDLAQAGDLRGTMWLARFHDLGTLSVPRDRQAAQDLSKRAISEVRMRAEKGDPESQFLLATAYHQGLAVERDLEKAVVWYSKAAAAGQLTAFNNLGCMLAYGHGTEPDIERARYCFSRAAELGSLAAARNVLTYSNAKRGDAARLRALRSVPLVQALGMKKDEGIKFLASKSLISDPNGYETDQYRELQRYRFRSDGIVLAVDISGRITNVEGHAKGSLGTNQFRGDLPLGLTWKTTGNSTLTLLGEPSERGYVKNDQAYGFAYQVDNLTVVSLIGYGGDQTLKLCRVYERWAAKYPDRQLTGDSK
jgi:Sel1 repeat-containing protein